MIYKTSEVNQQKENYSCRDKGVKTNDGKS